MPETLLVKRPSQAALVCGENGSIEGFAATWTYQGDGIRFCKGAFAKSISERAGKIPLMVKHTAHGGEVFETVGFITAGQDFDEGFFIKADFLPSELGQKTRALAVSGGIKAFSLSARPLVYEIKDNIAVTSEAALIDITLTNTPADSETAVIAARESAEQAAQAAASAEQAARKREAAMIRERLLAYLEKL